MKKLIYIVVGLIIVVSVYLLLPSEEYYIPKPKAKVKITLPSEETSIYVDDIITFNYSKSAFIDKEGENPFSIVYPNYDAYIMISIKPIEDLQKLVVDPYKEFFIGKDTLAVSWFVYRTLENCRLGGKRKIEKIENLEENYFGDICYFSGDKLALSSIFFLTDDDQYFLLGEVFFNNKEITNEIVFKNEIMKKEVANIINSFKWSSIPK